MSPHSYDELFIQIVDYVFDTPITSDLAFKTAYLALMDSLACATLALQVPQCTALLGPIVPETSVPQGARVPGTAFVLDPIKAAFDIGTCIRWLDYNDTWLAKEWAHPSDNLGAILAVGDYLSNRTRTPRLTVRDLLEAMIKAYEIQGILALENSFNQVGLDHVILVKVASSAVISKWLGLSKLETAAVLSHAFIDGNSLRTYRHAPNTGPRKSWAAGDAASRAVFLAWLVKQGQTGYTTALTAKHWGFHDVLFREQRLTLAKPLSSYVMENILFKVAYPAEFHAQTAVEAAFKLHPMIQQRMSEIDTIVIETQAPAMRIIDKIGPLVNYADRDHCLQYMVAVALIYGDLKPEYYEDNTAKDPRIDRLRDKMRLVENPEFSQNYLDPSMRSIANSIQIFFKEGTQSEKVIIEYPLGHKRRREEASSHLRRKYEMAISSYYQGKERQDLLALYDDSNANEEKISRLSIAEFISKFVKGKHAG